MRIILFLMTLASPLYSFYPLCEETLFYSAEQNKWELFEEAGFLSITIEVPSEAKKTYDIPYCPATVPCDCSQCDTGDGEYDYEEGYQDV